METGLGLIANERYEKQILKHGFTGQDQATHPEFYDKGQLIEASIKLSYTIANDDPPENWDQRRFSKLCAKSHKERLVISGALICGELDRLIWLENNP